MATYTLRPNANWNNASAFTISGGSASVHAALSDNSDSTYITRTSNTVPIYYEAEFQTQALTSNETVTSVNLRVRMSQTGGDTEFNIGTITDRTARTISYAVPIAKINDLTLGTIDLAYNLPSSPTGAAWDQTALDNLVVRFTDKALTSGAKANIYELYIDVVTTSKPTVTVTSPSGSVTDTSFPAINWTYADTDGAIQSAYEVKIFDSTTYSAAGFSPDTSTPTVETGIISSTNDGAATETDLANSTSYRAYVRVAKLVNGVNYFSAWAYSSFSLAVDAPAIPEVTAYFDTEIGAVTLTILGRSNFLTANQASIETNSSGWTAVENCSISRTTSQALVGTASLAVNGAGGGDSLIETSTSFVVRPLTAFTASAYVKAATTGRSARVGIIYYDADDVEIASTQGTAVLNTNASWTLIQHTANAPSNAVTGNVTVRIVGTASSEVHYVDKIAFHSGDVPAYSTGGFSSFLFDVQRSTDSVNWVTVRNSPVTAGDGQVATLTDYEAPLEQTVVYRAKARATA